jgi:tetratricopeptide (TPR) repeat protein
MQQQRERESVARESQAEPLFRRGEAAAKLGDMTRAEQYFVGALKAGGDEKRITQRLLVVCVADDRYPAALEYAEEYLHRHPGDAEVAFAAASLHLAVDHLDRARQLLERVVHYRPDWAEAHYALASVLRDQGESLELADVHDLEYLKLNPRGPLAERARARLSRAEP